MESTKSYIGNILGLDIGIMEKKTETTISDMVILGSYMGSNGAKGATRLFQKLPHLENLGGSAGYLSMRILPTGIWRLPNFRGPCDLAT